MPLRSGIGVPRSRGANNNIYIETITFNHFMFTTMDASNASVLLPHILWGRSLQNKTLTPTLTQTSRPMSSRHYTSWSWDGAGKKHCVTVVLFIVVLLWSWLLSLWLWLWSAWNKIFLVSLGVPENLDSGTWSQLPRNHRKSTDFVIKND